MSRGTVLAWKGEKGYGFIKPDEGGTDVFVHYTDIVSDDRRRNLTEGQAVEFNLVESERGVKAVEVRVV